MRIDKYKYKKRFLVGKHPGIFIVLGRQTSGSAGKNI